MASLVKTRSGIFYLVLSINGRRIWRSTGARTREEAEAVVREQYPEHLHTRSPGKLSDFLPQYLEYAEVNLAPSTVLLYRDSVRSFLRILGDKKLERYTAHDIERFKIVRAREVRPVRVNLEMRHLKSFYQTAVRWGMLAQNPFAGVKFVKIPPQRPVFFTREEFQRLLAAIPHQWFRDLVLFTVSTMLRNNEVVHLKWSSVDLRRRFIMVENTADHRLKTPQPHAVPMNEWVYQFLAARPHKTGNVFRFPDGRNLNIMYVSHQFTKYARAAGFPEGYHFHTLRHTGASWLVQDGVSVYAVQKLLGHSSIQVTMMYSHLVTSEMQESVNRINISEILSPSLTLIRGEAQDVFKP